jgi:hypothetical protein
MSPTRISVMPTATVKETLAMLLVPATKTAMGFVTKSTPAEQLPTQSGQLQPALAAPLFRIRSADYLSAMLTATALVMLVTHAQTLTETGDGMFRPARMFAPATMFRLKVCCRVRLACHLAGAVRVVQLKMARAAPKTSTPPAALRVKSVAAKISRIVSNRSRSARRLVLAATILATVKTTSLSAAKTLAWHVPAVG